MTQAVPSVLLYGQALALLQDLTKAQTEGDITGPVDFSQYLRDILTKYVNSAGGPIAEYEPVDETEPPLSAKMNRFWTNTLHDVSLLQHQLDLLRASTIFVHNSITTEIDKSITENAVLANKVKTLQLYSDSSDPSIITFGDFFHNDSFIDREFLEAGEQALIINDNFLALGKVGQLKNLTATSEVKVLTTSNGVLGNNQEVEDPNTAPVDPASNEKLYVFKSETQPAKDLVALTDGRPDTWIEYEYCQVKQEDRLTAKNFNFTYLTANVSEPFDWAKGPPDNELALGLHFTLKDKTLINQITYTPYGLENNKNFPVLIKNVQVSENGTTWVKAFPENVWVGNQPNLQAARTSDNVKARQVTWVFEQMYAKYVTVNVVQPNSIPAALGHVYWVNRKTNEREEGPNPNIDNIQVYTAPGRRVVGNQVQKREVFTGKRWAIGIRDFLIQQIEFREISSVITTPMRSGGIVDRVSLEADIYIPPEWDQELNWVEFYVSPNDGLDWHPISRVQDDFLGIPEVLAFNDPIPPPFREPGVEYVSTGTPVRDLRLKIVLNRPRDQKFSSPLVRSYKLKIKKR